LSADHDGRSVPFFAGGPNYPPVIYVPRTALDSPIGDGDSRLALADNTDSLAVDNPRDDRLYGVATAEA